MATKPKKARVMIAVPCTNFMDAKTAHSIGGAIIKGEGMVVDFIIRQSCEISSARSWLIQEALQKQLTHILFVDSDMYLPSDIIPRLVKREKDIIGVEYPKRKFPIETIGAPLTERTEDKPYEAGYAGTGCMLIDLSIFKNPEKPFPQPWFSFATRGGELIMGEDVFFCNMARQAGYEVWIDPTIKVGHVGEFIYTL